MDGTVLSQFLSICWLTLQGFQFRCKLRAPRIWGIVIIERFFLIFSALVIFLKGFTKEIWSWKYRVFAKNCKIFTEPYCSHFFIFWGFLILIFALHCYILVFLKILKICVFTQHTKTTSNLENPQFSIELSWKCWYFIFCSNFVCCVKTQKNMKCRKYRYTEIQRKKQN